MNKKDLANRLKELSIELAKDGDFGLSYIINCISHSITMWMEDGEPEALEFLDTICHQIMEGSFNEEDMIPEERDLAIEKEMVKSKSNPPRIDPIVEIYFDMATPPNGPEGFM